MVKVPQVLAHLLTFGLAGVFVSCAGTKPTPPMFEGRKISKLTIRPGWREGVDEKRIRTLLERELGPTYADARIDRAISAVMDTGFVDDVRLLAEPTGNGVALIAEIKPRPPMGPSGFVGNTAFSDACLAKASGIQGVVPMGPKTIETGRKNIEAFYRQYGYKQVKVSGDFPKRMTLARALHEGEFRFMIEEGPQSGS